MTFLRFMLGRVLQAVPVLIGVTVFAFLLLYIVPGDPARNVLGPLATDEAIQALRDRYDLDDPPLTRYLAFLGGLLQGDLGESIYWGTPVGDLVASRLGVSAALVATGVVLAVVIAIPLAMLAAVREDRIADHSVRAFSVTALGLPTVWVGLMLILIFGVRLRWLPVGGIGSSPTEFAASLVLPGLTIALSVAPLFIRSLRSGILDILHSEFIVSATAKGITGARMLLRHVLPNSVVPMLTVVAVQLSFLLGGTVVVENVFGVPGLGQLLFDAISHRDFAVVQGIALVLAIAVILITLVLDLAVGIIDPRTRKATR